MKRLFVLLVAVLLATTAFATPPPPEGGEITFLSTYAADDPLYIHALDAFHGDFPDVTVTQLGLDLSDGSTMTMDALLAAGLAPNVYSDYIGRVSKYLVPEYALPLNDVVRDLDMYLPGVLEPYTRDGNVMGLPQPGGAQGMVINADLMRAIGFEVRWNWTIAEFLEMCELVRRHYDGEKWGTGMFAANQSGDYLINNWFASFNVDYYQGGDYTKTTIASSGGEKVYRFFQMLVRGGYIPEGAETLTDDDYVLYWARGELAATAFFPSWVKPYQDVVAEQGYDVFEYRFVPFPSEDGKGTPTYVSNAAIVVQNTGTEADIWAARFAEYFNDGWVQTQISNTLAIPNRSDAEFLPDNDRVAETARIVADYGIMDVGLTTPFFAPRRPLHFPILQDVLRLRVTPEEGIARYEAALNSVQ